LARPQRAVQLLALGVELRARVVERGPRARLELGRREPGLQRQRELLAVQLGAEPPVTVGVRRQLGLEELLVRLERRQRAGIRRVATDELLHLALHEVDRALVALDRPIDVDPRRVSLAPGMRERGPGIAEELRQRRE